ncbi:putative glutathione-S-transferase theta, GST [Talaromyces proteolyticus]|uniref:glutathione transferase n=1 Tax=Talaromyces proteolyticus TaxID=1131652 RepID=A0AAD4KYN6_9EURO|nr:putative glutathione-S-transferase theta, GST [Talaromyces proteolyticus]KAH8703387.1 putative glutathione-S-transferase theta, GST [Talaromyces proteolyticus]
MPANKESLRLIGLAKSTCTTRILLVFAEKKIEFSFYQPDMANGELKTPPLLNKNPFGTVPILEDGEYVIFESRAIARYLAIKYANIGTPLVPPWEDLKAWALFEQWASVELSHFDPPATTIYLQKYVFPLRGKKTDEFAVTAALEVLQMKLDILDDILSKQQYLAGQTFSLVDIFYAPTISGLIRAGETELITSRSHLNDWWLRFTARPSWKMVLEAYHAHEQ